MVFTIEVKKEENRQELEFAKLEMFHRECHGGRIKVKTVYSDGREENKKRFAWWFLECQRCRDSVEISSYEASQIIATAIDGKRREFHEGYIDSELDKVGPGFVAVPKT